MAFDPERYWNERHEATRGLDGVGFLGLRGLNEWMYRVRRRVFRRTVRQSGVDVTEARVLDVGSGTGFYLERWTELGARELVGTDFSEVAVERLRGAYPNLRIEPLDITTEEPLDALGTFDLISVMDVLYHVVDDDAYARAFANLARLLNPGGRIVFTENFLHRSSDKDHAWHTSRRLDEVERAVQRGGLVIERRRPWFVLMNEPVDSDSKLHAKAWWWMQKLSEKVPGAGYTIGAALYPSEVVLTRLLREGPTSEIAIARRAT
ncbi:MAG: class I SAM-dependent methyltransferase [Deltaproteobacteria bacterium]